MTAIAVDLLTAIASAMLIVVMVTRRTWFQRHVRHWKPAWWVILVAAGVVFATTIAALVTRGPDQGDLPFAAPLAALTSAAALLFVSLQRPEVKVPQARQVLVVAAHPDDLELAAGGSLARFADRGHEVRAIIMSDGSVGGDAAIRPDEALSAGRYLGLRNLSLHKYTDTQLGTQMGAMIRTIEDAIAETKPDLILTHSANDQHQDHHAVHLAVLRAARQCPSVLCFESPSVTPEFDPRFFVDISDYLEAKVGAVEWHANQMGKPYMGADRLKGKAIYRGSQARVSHAEGFEVVRLLSSSVGEL